MTTDVKLFITDVEAEQGMISGKFKNHREFVGAEFAKHMFLIEDFDSLRYERMLVSIKGHDMPGFLISGVLNRGIKKI